MGKILRITSVVVLALLLIVSWSERGDGTDMKDVRKSILAGSWYPGNPAILASDIDGFLKNVPAEILDGDVIALISPHAGYTYSGQVAAYSYKLVEGKTFDAVIVIGPSHRTYFGGVSIYDKGGYETPLGIVPIDTKLADEIIARSPMISSIPTAHMQEHSVEIQLPFLQAVLGGFSFVPVVMGDQRSQTCEELADAIFRSVADKKVLIVASSDLSHFHSYDMAVEMDSVVLDQINKMDPGALLKSLERGACEACGGGPMAVVMMVAKKLGADSVKVLKYANSGDVTGDRSGVVGYASAAFYKSTPSETVKGDPTAGIDMGLKETEKTKLLEIARSAIESKISGEEIPEFKLEETVLTEKRGAFVTLHRHGQLRGCIGFIEAKKPLHETIEEMAVSAAFKDPRFSPVSREELKDLSIEISVLSPLKEIDDINEIEVGVHGIYIVKGFYSGILLPQVATKYKWNRRTFLKETCHKAGLPSDAWSDKDTKIYIFSADIFGETE